MPQSNGASRSRNDRPRKIQPAAKETGPIHPTANSMTLSAMLRPLGAASRFWGEPLTPRSGKDLRAKRVPASFALGTGGFTGRPSLKYLTTSCAKSTLAAAPRITSIALKFCLLAVETPSSINTTSYWRLKAWKAVEMMQSSVQAPTCQDWNQP